MSDAVIVPAEKFPDESLLTMALLVFEFVAAAVNAAEVLHDICDMATGEDLATHDDKGAEKP